MDRLLGDLLDYSRLTNADMPRTQVDLDQVAMDVLSALQGEIQSRGAVVEVGRPLGEAIGHAPTLGQIMSNLICNGLKFVAPGVTPQLRVRAEIIEGLPEGPASGTNPVQSSQRRRFRLWFEDNGIGIPRGSWERAFQMFQRLDKRYEGTGIGLAVVKKCCERMAAKISLESEPGQGSKFKIEFPTGEFPISGKVEAAKLRGCENTGRV